MQNTKAWHSCPNCGGETVLFVSPHKYAGTWECQARNCGASDTCEHEDRRVESTQVDHWPTPDIDASYDVDVYVCNDCEVTIPLDEADPAVDAYDAMIDSQIDEMRGK